MSDEWYVFITFATVAIVIVLGVAVGIAYNDNRRTAFLTECIKVESALDCGAAWSGRGK